MMDTRRILSIALASRRLGFVVTDNNINIIDYGTREVAGSSAEIVKQKVKTLVEGFQPHFICIQDIQDSECQLGEASRIAIANLEKWLSEIGIPFKAVSKSDVWHSLNLPYGNPKEAVVNVLQNKYPEFEQLSYKKRRAWEAEHWNTPVFLALSFIETLP